MSENGIFLYFWTKKVIFKHPPPPPVYIGQKLTIREKMAYFCILRWKKKLGLHMIKLSISSKIKQKCVAETPQKMPYPG